MSAYRRVQLNSLSLCLSALSNSLLSSREREGKEYRQYTLLNVEWQGSQCLAPPTQMSLCPLCCLPNSHNPSLHLPIAVFANSDRFEVLTKPTHSAYKMGKSHD
ncbi:hypothetical protein WR25_00867 [Diploscapter pachys]|uniref:Uncharacterized protein n=1 Tax=Diploscapter pachys TaxID=2018661 RepID=A0A2A2L198_9BILA|nr:hypothetical protein WR25_00867 [Diploscapter pachys]